MCIVQYRAAIGNYHSWLQCKQVKLFLKILRFLCIKNENSSFNIKISIILTIGYLLSVMLTTLLAVMLLLLIAGDVHPNPGPVSDFKSFSICHLNSRSLLQGVDLSQDLKSQPSRLDEIELLLINTMHFDIIGISETRLQNDIEKEYIMLENYQIFRHDRPDGRTRGGGVMAYVSSNIPAIHRPDLEICSGPAHESLWIELYIDRKKVLFNVTYRSPDRNAVNTKAFIDDFQTELSLAISLNPETIISTGDFNDKCIVWDDEHSTSDLGKDLFDMINYNNLYQIINEPTRVTQGTLSLLDLVITDSPGYITDFGTLEPLDNLDHKCVYASFKFQLPTKFSYTREIWHFNNGNFVALNQALSAVNWQQFLDESNEIEIFVDFLADTLKTIASMFIPKYIIKFTNKDKPWMTGYIKHLIRIRNRWCGQFLKRPNDYHKHMKDLYQLLTRLEIQNAKHVHTERLKNSLSDPNITIKKYWSLSNAIFGIKVHPPIPTLIHNNIHYITDLAKSELLADHFANQCSLPPPSNDFMLPDFHFTTNARISELSFTPNQILKVLQSLNPSRATGPDGIGNRLLKSCASSLSTPLTLLINRSLQESVYPAQWKMANLCAVFKKADRTKKENYRPISILDCMSKVCERLVFNALYQYCTENNILNPRNSGFKKNDSTVNQLTKIVHDIYMGLEDQKDVCMVFLDVSKAFDKVYHEGLLFKLKQIGVTGSLLNWMKSYLSDRKIRVTLNGKCSGWKEINAGVPQGSILGPLLYLIYVNDITNDIESDINLFADDTSLLKVIYDPTQSFQVINSDLAKLEEWSKQWRTSFNADKTVYIIFSRKNQQEAYPNLNLGNQVLKQVDSHTHLGLTFNSRLTWDDHIDKICTKAHRRVDSLRRIRFLVPRHVLENLYKSVIRSVLDYADVVYSGLSDTLAKKLEGVQRSAALVCTGAFRNTSHVLLLSELGWDELIQRREKHKVVLFHKIVNGLSPPYLQELLPEKSRSPRTPYNYLNFKCRTTSYASSFFPSVVQKWNSLSDLIKSSTSTRLLKTKLESLNDIKYRKYFSYGSGNEHTHHARMRMGLSALRWQLYEHHIVDNPICCFCTTNEPETVEHYLLHCPTFKVQRTLLVMTLILEIPLNFLQQCDLCQCLLYGHDQWNYQTNLKISKAVQEYIKKTKRFDFQQFF